MTGVLIRERRGRIRPQRPRRDHVEGEADGHKPRNHRELEEAGYSPRVSGGGMVLTPPSFWTSASGTPGDHVSVDLSHPAAGNVFRQPCETSTVAQIKGGAIWAPNEESTAQRGRPRRLRAVLREAVVPRALQGAARGGQAGRDQRGPPPSTAPAQGPGRGRCFCLPLAQSPLCLGRREQGLRFCHVLHG